MKTRIKIETHRDNADRITLSAIERGRVVLVTRLLRDPVSRRHWTGSRYTGTLAEHRRIMRAACR